MVFTETWLDATGTLIQLDSFTCVQADRSLYMCVCEGKLVQTSQ